MSYKFLIAGRLHNSRLGYCVVNSISDQGHIMGSGKIFIDDVTVTDPVTGEITTYPAGYSPEFAMIWRNPQALPEIFGIAPGATLQGAFHAQSGTLHRDGTVIISNKRPEDIFVNNNATLQRWPNSANGGGIQTSPPYSSPTYSYPAPGGSFAFGSSLSNSPISPIMSWIWPASSGPQSLYSVTRSAPGAPALNFQSLPTTIGSAPGGEACVNLSGQVLVGHSGRYHQVPALQGATKISPHGAALLPGTFGNPAIWYGGSTYSLSSCVANPQALGTTLTVRDVNENGSMLAIVNVGLGSQRLVILTPVEVEQQNYSSAQGIRFCRWLDSFTGNSLDPDCADNDRDRFRIRIPAVLPNLTKIRIKSSGLLTAVINGQWVSKSTDGDYEVTMTEENGAMVSKWMLLVSDGDDDVGYNGIGTDNGPNDQTLLANFNSPIEVTLPEYQNAKVVFAAQKPLGDVEIQPYYLSPSGDVPPDMERFITNHLEKMKEIYRQIGVRVGNYGIVGKAVPQAWFDAKPAANEVADYLTPSESNFARAAVRGMAVPGKQIRIGFVNATVMQNSNNPFEPDPIRVRGFTDQGSDGIIVSLEPLDARTILGVTAHEAGHTLGLDHPSSTWNRWLMKGDGMIWNQNTLDSKRAQSGEFEIIRNRQSFYVPYVPN